MRLHGKTGLRPNDPILLILRDQQKRIEKLETEANQTFLKKLTASASASALFLGLVLTFVSLYDAFVTKPEVDRVTRISQFNQAVNAAGKMRQDLTELRAKTTDPAIQLEAAGFATGQILNHISTAKAIMRDLRKDDIGIPQLLILAMEASSGGDYQSVKEFIDRAVAIKATPFLHSEAKRYEGKCLFGMGDPQKGRESYLDAIDAITNFPGTAPARAYILTDLVSLEFLYKDCANASIDFGKLAAIVQTQEITRDQRMQLSATLKGQIGQVQGQQCAIPDAIGGVLVNQ